MPLPAVTKGAAWNLPRKAWPKLDHDRWHTVNVTYPTLLSSVHTGQHT